MESILLCFFSGSIPGPVPVLSSLWPYSKVNTPAPPWWSLAPQYTSYKVICLSSFEGEKKFEKADVYCQTLQLAHAEVGSTPKHNNDDSF